MRCRHFSRSRHRLTDDLEFDEDDIELILEHWLRPKFGASLEIRFEQEAMQ
jgi:hypothetical protein